MKAAAKTYWLGALALLYVTFTALAAVVSGSYLVLTPRIIHPGWPLNIAVSIHKTKSPTPVAIQAILTGKHSKLLSQEISYVRAGQSRILTLKVPDIEDAVDYQYKLKVEGSGGLRFSETAPLTINKNRTLTMVQTDKKIYKPGQLVRFRILQINKDLAPVMNPLTAYILNTKGNKLERYGNITSRSGVVSREFQLSKYASLGLWSVQLQNEQEDVIYHHDFEVDEYVLPKFSVEVTPDPDFLVWGIYDQPPGIIVKSMYTFGKAVQGECILTLGQKGSSNIQKLSQKITPTGIVEFKDINWDGLIGAKPIEKKVLLAIVEVKDIMGRSEYGEATINVFRQDYKVEILPPSPEIIHNGLATDFYFRVSDHYNNPVPGQRMDVTFDMPDQTTVTVTVTMLEGEAYAKQRFLPVWNRESSAGSDVSVFGSNLEGSISVKLVSDEMVSAKKKLYWYYSVSMENIKIQAPNQAKFTIGQAFTFDVERTGSPSPSSTMYTIVSQGIILMTGVVSGSKLTVTPTFDMCPKARVVIYHFVGPDSGSTSEDWTEIIADSYEFSPVNCMDKQVSVRFDAREQRTGTDANLQINVQMKTGAPMPRQAYDVFYLAVDKSIVLLQGDTSMTERKIMDVLDKTNSWTQGITQTTADSVFNNFNLAVMTNATLADKLPDPRIYFDEGLVLEEAFPLDDAMTRTKSDAVVEEKPKETMKHQAVKKIRKDFPETWLWDHGKTTESGQFRTQVRLPDTITSWYVSAFGINEDGMVGSGTPFELTAFNPFFVSMNLPYSIKRGEVFSLRVTVFNYRPQEIRCIISLEMSDDFIITGGKPKNNYMEHVVTMLPNLASVVTYEINASTIGKIKFHIVAQDVQDAAQRDEIERELRVKPPGEERNQVISSVLLLVDGRALTKLFQIDWPYDEIIEGSQRLQVKVTGTVLGQSLSNLQGLVRQPTGCGEQNMIGMVPNVYGAAYIVHAKQPNTEAMLNSMIKNMNTGYQRQVDLYQRKDGSYSAWASDATGSTWLTAFVMKSFAAATTFITVDNNVLNAAISFMKSKQGADGYFKEDGRLLHKALQSGTSEDLSLTVYCLLSILETTEVVSTTQLTLLLDKTVPLITRSTSKIISTDEGSTFLPAMTAYTFSLIAKQDPSRQNEMKEFIDALLSYIDETSAPWRDSTEDDKEPSSTLHAARQKTTTTLMSAAYTLMTYINQKDMGNAFKVMKWLQAQQNSNGGFGSTQDTVLVLQSLAQFAILYSKVDATGQVIVSVPGFNFTDTLDISGDRSILLQQMDIPNVPDIVNVTLTGETNTIAFVKVVSFYNTPVTVQANPGGLSRSGGVDIKTRTKYLSVISHEVEACVNSDLTQGVGMYVTTFNLASGEAPGESVEMMKARNPGVSQVEFEEGHIHAYMNDIPKDGYCVKAYLERQLDFSVQQPGSAKVYSYYEPEYYKESELALPDPNSKCQGDPCGSASTLSLTSLILTILICFMTSLLACL